MTRRRGVAALLIGLLVAGCALDGPRPAARPDSEPASVPASVQADRSRTASPSAPAANGSLPGRPYVAEDILTAMRDSRRPGGVPAELQVDAVAAGIAGQAWTWDGDPWATLGITAACGTTSCSLDLAGGASEGDGTDLYSFTVDRRSGEVELVATDLHGYPPALEADMDAAARAALRSGRLAGMALVGARWLPPPDTDRYWLAYRSGGEEGSPRLDVLLDLHSGEVLDVVEAG